VAVHWQWLEADPQERALFADLPTLLALPRLLAAPRHRTREVHRIDQDDRTWYLKTFHGTQWKNRLRFRLTPPRARSDAEREARVTEALRAAGVEAPRPVAVIDDPTTGDHHYLCAAMAGKSLRQLVAAGQIDAFVARAVAFFCGELLYRGFHLPDLSAEHVFVRMEIAFFHLGVLDLNNGTLAPPGPVPLWLLRRVLRHFADSVSDLSVPPARALVFALRLVRAAGRSADARALLAGMPQFGDTARRYQRPGKAAEYAGRNPARHARELQLLRKVWPGRRGDLVLDSPCGTGRLLPLLRSELHARVLWADAAATMLEAAQIEHPLGTPPRCRADALHLPLADRSVDGVVMFRFLHHLPPVTAKLAVAEACRVARAFVVLSFFHKMSAHWLQRRALMLFGNRPRRHAMTLARVRGWCAVHGFRMHAAAAELPYVRDLWVVSFVRSH